MEDCCDAVVVLIRLPEYKIRALRPPTPQQFYSEDESHSSSDSDMQWEPEDDSSDSDFSASNNGKKAVKPLKIDTTRLPAPQTSSNNNSNKNNHGNSTDNTVTKTSQIKIPNYPPLTPWHFLKEFLKLQDIIVPYTFCVFSTLTEPNPIIESSAFGHSSHETTKIRPDLPEEEVKVDMMVLTRKRRMRWQRGKTVEIVAKGKKKITLVRKTQQ